MSKRRLSRGKSSRRLDSHRVRRPNPAGSRGWGIRTQPLSPPLPVKTGAEYLTSTDTIRPAGVSRNLNPKVLVGGQGRYRTIRGAVNRTGELWALNPLSVCPAWASKTNRESGRNRRRLRFIKGSRPRPSMSTESGPQAELPYVKAGLNRDELLDLLEGPLEELARKIEKGRIRDRENEELRIKQWRALAYVARCYNDILSDAEEESVEARLEALEAELGLREGGV